MPQFRIEYSANLSPYLDREGVLGDLAAISAEIVGSPPSAHKVRFNRLDEAMVGDGSRPLAMIHAELHLLSGRTDEIKQALSLAVLNRLAKALDSTCPIDVQITADVCDMNPACYQKIIVEKLA